MLLEMSREKRNVPNRFIYSFKQIAKLTYRRTFMTHIEFIAVPDLLRSPQPAIKERQLKVRKYILQNH